jgi:hypothetical protein
MDKVIITMTKQLDGINFGLSPLDLKKLKEEFPDSTPTRKVFVSFDYNETDFQLLFEKVKKYFLPVLTGIEDPKELKKIRQIHFFDPSKRIPDATIDLN